jgi:hypothetical protein
LKTTALSFYKMGLDTKSDLEKPSQLHHEHADLNFVDSSDDPILSEFTAEEASSIIHRIDRRLILTVGLMYCISLMDRTNLGAAAIAGLVK